VSFGTVIDQQHSVALRAKAAHCRASNAGGSPRYDHVCHTLASFESILVAATLNVAAIK
jgi:hypothetical protein